MEYWREFQYYNILQGSAPPYDEASWLATQWFLAFDRIERKVQAELQRQQRR